MRAAAIAVAGALAACSDGPVEMTLQVPTTMTALDTSCIASVQVAALGASYDQDNTDYKIACVDLPMSEPTLADVQAALHGLVSLPIPDSGLSKIAVYGNSTSCAALPSTAPLTADLIFYASAPYDGGPIALTMIPNLSCKTSTVTALPIEMLALASAHTCSTAHVPDSATAGVNIGTLEPSQVGKGVTFSGGLEASSLTDGVATITNARTAVAAGACLALYAGDDSQDAITCAVPTPPVCATAGQLEVGVLPQTTAFQTTDQPLQAQFGPPTFGLVYGGAGDTGAPIAGATVTLDDPSAGSVIYLDAGAAAIAGTGALTKLPGAATNASGLFVVYASGFHALTVSGGGATVHLTVAAEVGDPGTAIIRLH